MTPILRSAILLVLFPIGTLSCAQAPVRRLPVNDEMPPAPSATVPAGDLLSFYPRAPSVLESPPDLARYGIECSVPIEGGYFTLTMRDDMHEALFTLTEKPVTSLAKAVSFGADPKKSLDWGFVYDRNGDGWVDYIVFLDGAMPVATPEVLALVPKRPMPREGDSYTMSREEAALQMLNIRLVFTHYIDDNFDGKTDAIVSSLLDPDHWGWVYRRAVLRSSDHSQSIDEHWVFVKDIAEKEGPIPREPDGNFVRLGGISKKGNAELSSDRFDGVSWPFDSANAGLRACQIPRGVLPRE
jgi:hypothetical protein